MTRLGSTLTAALTASVLLAAGCGGESGAADRLGVTWAFASGDCASNGVANVRVHWRERGAASYQQAPFACGAGAGSVGPVSRMGGTYEIYAEGDDAGGQVVAVGSGGTVTFSAGAAGLRTVDITLRPRPADLVVTWRHASGGTCPRDVVLPYFVTLYRPPAMAGGALTDRVIEVQESCALGRVTLGNVAPGSYVVEVDSRAVTPRVRGTVNVTVVAGQPAQAMLTF